MGVKKKGYYLRMCNWWSAFSSRKKISHRFSVVMRENRGNYEIQNSNY